jgi:hypothetical protein
MTFCNTFRLLADLSKTPWIARDGCLSIALWGYLAAQRWSARIVRIALAASTNIPRLIRALVVMFSRRLSASRALQFIRSREESNYYRILAT